MKKEQQPDASQGESPTGAGYVPSELRKGYQPRPLPQGVVLSPPPGPAGDVPIEDASKLPDPGEDVPQAEPPTP